MIPIHPKRNLGSEFHEPLAAGPARRTVRVERAREIERAKLVGDTVRVGGAECVAFRTENATPVVVLHVHTREKTLVFRLQQGPNRKSGNGGKSAFCNSTRLRYMRSRVGSFRFYKRGEKRFRGRKRITGKQIRTDKEVIIHSFEWHTG
jgi:hypothetical protein